MRDMNFVTVSVSGFYFVSVPYFRTEGNVISTCFSIVYAPKSQLSSYTNLRELQYNNGYWWDRIDQGTTGKLKE